MHNFSLLGSGKFFLAMPLTSETIKKNMTINKNVKPMWQNLPHYQVKTQRIYLSHTFELFK